MSTTLAIRYVAGQAHATPWDRHPNEAAVEWPPSPWRMLRALYAVWKERAAELPADDVIGLLSQIAEQPPIYRLPPASHAHTRHWYPTSGHRSDPKGYSKTLALDAFMSVDPSVPLYVTFDVDLAPAHLQALKTLTNELTYLGRSESQVVVDVLVGGAPTSAGHSDCAPATVDASIDEAAIRLLVPVPPLDVEALTASTTVIQRRRLSIPPGSHQIAYSVPDRPKTGPARVSRKRRTVTAAVWNVAGATLPAVRSALLQGDALHQQILLDFKQVSGGGHSLALSGCDDSGRPLRDDHGHAHALHYDLDGDGLLDAAILWAPAGLSPEDVEAVTRVRGLKERPWLRDFRQVHLGLEHLGGPEGLPRQVGGPARTWTSFTPFAPPHHPKQRQRQGAGWAAFVEAQVRKSCVWWGVPPPLTIVLEADQPWLTYRRHRSHEQLRQARRATGVTLTFAEPVRGPIALGALAHYGLGVFLPVIDTS